MLWLGLLFYFIFDMKTFATASSSFPRNNNMSPSWWLEIGFCLFDFYSWTRISVSLVFFFLFFSIFIRLLPLCLCRMCVFPFCIYCIIFGLSSVAFYVSFFICLCYEFNLQLYLFFMVVWINSIIFQAQIHWNGFFKIGPR